MLKNASIFSPFSLLPNYRWSKAKGANPQKALFRHFVAKGANLQNACQYWQLLGICIV
jgi:hypothetical protein